MSGRNPEAHSAVSNSNLRLVAVFIMGISVGICVTLIYVTARDHRPALVQDEIPSDQQGSRK